MRSCAVAPKGRLSKRYSGILQIIIALLLLSNAACCVIAVGAWNQWFVTHRLTHCLQEPDGSCTYSMGIDKSSREQVKILYNKSRVVVLNMLARILTCI